MLDETTQSMKCEIIQPQPIEVPQPPIDEVALNAFKKVVQLTLAEINRSISSKVPHPKFSEDTLAAKHEVIQISIGKISPSQLIFAKATPPSDTIQFPLVEIVEPKLDKNKKVMLEDTIRKMLGDVFLSQTEATIFLTPKSLPPILIETIHPITENVPQPLLNQTILAILAESLQTSLDNIPRPIAIPIFNIHYALDEIPDEVKKTGLTILNKIRSVMSGRTLLSLAAGAPLFIHIGVIQLTATEVAQLRNSILAELSSEPTVKIVEEPVIIAKPTEETYRLLRHYEEADRMLEAKIRKISGKARNQKRK